MKRLDFTFRTYRKLLEVVLNAGYKPMTFEEFIRFGKNDDKVVIFRHDVDRVPENSLRIAMIENEFHIKSSFYFRTVWNCKKSEIIKKIAGFGHEIGYHYEDLTKVRGKKEKAIRLFEKNLAYLRQFYPVSTICMHGSPLSKWNNKDIWKYYSYRDYGIIGEPYFDLDYETIVYFTDTGRRWNGLKFSVRDKVNVNEFNISSTFRLIESFRYDKLKNRVLINVHPNRWHNNTFSWIYEFFFQNIKNVIKRFFFVQKHD